MNSYKILILKNINFDLHSKQIQFLVIIFLYFIDITNKNGLNILVNLVFKLIWFKGGIYNLFKKIITIMIGEF